MGNCAGCSKPRIPMRSQAGQPVEQKQPQRQPPKTARERGAEKIRDLKWTGK